MGRPTRNEGQGAPAARRTAPSSFPLDSPWCPQRKGSVARELSDRGVMAGIHGASWGRGESEMLGFSRSVHSINLIHPPDSFPRQVVLSLSPCYAQGLTTRPCLLFGGREKRSDTAFDPLPRTGHGRRRPPALCWPPRRHTHLTRRREVPRSGRAGRKERGSTPTSAAATRGPVGGLGRARAEKADEGLVRGRAEPARRPHPSQGSNRPQRGVTDPGLPGDRLSGP